MLGNICAGVALLLFLFPLQYILHSPATRGGNSAGENVIAVTLLMIPLCLFCLLALCAVTASGGFAWLGWSRGSQYAGVIASCLAMMTVAWCAAALRGEPLSQIR